jgi:hypothetical protein
LAGVTLTVARLAVASITTTWALIVALYGTLWKQWRNKIRREMEKRRNKVRSRRCEERRVWGARLERKQSKVEADQTGSGAASSELSRTAQLPVINSPLPSSTPDFPLQPAFLSSCLSSKLQNPHSQLD